MIITAITAVERLSILLKGTETEWFLSLLYKSLSKITTLLPCFSSSKKKKQPRGKKLTKDAAIFKINPVTWPQTITWRKLQQAGEKMLFWP